jgi:hypothetical protein
MPQVRKTAFRPKRRPARRVRSKKATAPRSVKTSGLPIRAPLGTTLIAGLIPVDRVAETLGMSKVQLAEMIGLKREAFYKASRRRAPKTQARIRELLEIVNRVSEWAGGNEQALAWYRAQPIPAFGDRTAESLVKSGKASVLRDYLDHLAMGGFA